MRVHILFPLTLDYQFQELGLFFTSRKDEVKFITVDDRCHAELLIIPDSGGYDTTRALFMPKHKLPPQFPPQDPHMQWFLQYQLQYFIDKKVKIVGFGTGALMLWDVLGGKAMIDDGKVELVMPLPAHVDVETTDFGYKFQSSQFLGLSHFNFNNKNYREIAEFAGALKIVEEPGDFEDAPVLVE